jgi:hypothetical protein
VAQSAQQFLDIRIIILRHWLVHSGPGPVDTDWLSLPQSNALYRTGRLAKADGCWAHTSPVVCNPELSP